MYILNKKISKSSSKLAFEIENCLNLQGGLQDHYSASYGGLNIIILKNGKVNVKMVMANKI